MTGPEDRKVPDELKGADQNELQVSGETLGEKKDTGEKAVTRRELLATAGTLGAAMAADALLSNPAVAAVSGRAMSKGPTDESFCLPLNLDTTRNFETMLQALEDPRVRQGLLEQEKGLPQGVKELVLLLDDKEFRHLADDAVAKYNELMLGDLSKNDAVLEAGRQLYEFMNARYPAGFEMLRSYVTSVRQPHMCVGVNVEVAANAYAVANAVVWANVAVATMAVVVAAVFVAT